MSLRNRVYCLWCKHFRPEESDRSNRSVCTAFPEGIPDAIISGDHSHQTPYPGDHGIQFEMREEMRQKYAHLELEP